MDGPTQTSLDDMKVKDVHELVGLETHVLIERLAAAPFPPSEKLIGAVLLKAVADLREATADVAESSRRIDSGTGRLQTAAWITLVVAIVTLTVAIIALVK
jgi:hypothetical protein